jgi:hypothetical protein
MPMSGSQISVTTTAAKIVDASHASVRDTTPAIIANQDSTNSVWLGGSGVATSGGSAGYELKAGKSISVSVVAGDDVYAVANTTVRVDVLRGRV